MNINSLSWSVLLAVTEDDIKLHNMSSSETCYMMCIHVHVHWCMSACACVSRLHKLVSDGVP